MTIKNPLSSQGLAALILGIATIFSPNLTAKLTPDRIDASNEIDNINFQIDPFRIIDNLWWVGHSQVGSFLIITSDGLILLDSTSTEDAHWVVENIVNAGFKLGDIKYILNTHPHAEHIGGTAALQQLLPEAKIITSKATAKDMATGGINDYRYVFENEGMNLQQRFTPVIVDGTIDHLGELTLGNVTMVAHLTPGHTLGTTTWTMKVKDKGKDYQVVVMGGMSAPGHDSGPLLNNELYPNIVEDFQTSFAHLKELQCDVYLYVRAASIEMDSKLAMLKQGDYQVNPFVDPKGCRNYIDFYEARFQKQLDEEMAESRR
jgi:metallo-beta-lactamase class B